MKSKMIFKNKTILLTGGTGSFGRKFVEIVLKEYGPRAIRIFSRDEMKQDDMQRHFHDARLHFFIGDVRDRIRIKRVCGGADIVVHAAALKQVPSCEANPFEAVKTNIIGSQNVIDAALDGGVEKVIMVSSDKSVEPLDLYGATKLCGEKLFVHGNFSAPDDGPRMSCARYGNMMGSRGSVIPLFLTQKVGGVLTITDERMTRFWATREEMVRFVIQGIERMKGGEIFVPKLPGGRVIDLADVVAPKAKKKIVGLRPGEKLHTVLLTPEEARHAKEFDTFFVIEPEYSSWKGGQAGGRSIPRGFRYASDTNKHQLTKKDFKRMLKNT